MGLVDGLFWIFVFGGCLLLFFFAHCSVGGVELLAGTRSWNSSCLERSVGRWRS